MSSHTPQDRTVIYVRQSMDRKGDELAVSRQLALCHKYAAQHGWTVEREFKDNDTSATSGATRSGFEALLASKPDRVVVWHVDRLVRLTRDLERVIDLGADVHAVKAGRLDLSNPAGRAVARTVTAWATYETEQKADRQKAANDQRAELGLPYRCQRAFGYERDGLTVREFEAKELRHAAEGVLRGRSLKTMAHDLNERGVRTATGKTWRTTTLKAALLSPRNAGKRRHRGEVVGKATWPAILDETTAASVKAVLTDPARSQRGPSRRYLLSGVMTCGRCGGPIAGAFVKGKGETYRCQQLHLTRKAGPVDETVAALVVARLSRPDAIELFARKTDRSRLLTRITEEQGACRARLNSLAEAFAVGDIDREGLAAGSRRLREQMEALDRELASVVEDPTLRELVTGADVEAAFGALPLETRRAVVRQLLDVVLLPVGSGRRRFDPEQELRVTWHA